MFQVRNKNRGYLVEWDWADDSVRTPREQRRIDTWDVAGGGRQGLSIVVDRLAHLFLCCVNASNCIDMLRALSIAAPYDDGMDRKAAETLIKGFVADFEIGGESVPMDRVIATHQVALRALRKAGVISRGTAALAARGEGRRRNGGLISADQIRADAGRLRRHGALQHEELLKTSRPPRPQVVPCGAPNARDVSTRLEGRFGDRSGSAIISYAIAA